MATDTADRRRSTRPQVIVVADDYEAARSLWGLWLTQLGFDVIEATTGAEALVRTEQHNPRVILMDLGMPVMDGLEATRRLKEDPRTAGVPVVMVTAYASDQHRRAAEQAGCAAFLTKPADLDELLAVLRR